MSDELYSKEEKTKVTYYYEEIERIKNRIARDRDNLRDLISEAEGTLEDVDNFLELQEEALDVLSQTL